MMTIIIVRRESGKAQDQAFAMLLGLEYSSARARQREANAAVRGGTGHGDYHLTSAVYIVTLPLIGWQEGRTLENRDRSSR